MLLRRTAAVAICLSALVYLACQRSVPSSNLCYDKHVVPLVKRDCAFCHENGEYGVTLVGNAGDFAELARYVQPYGGEKSPLVDWARGKNNHPVLWDNGSDEQEAIVGWINEGARETCFDRDKHGECRDDSDCLEVSCICPGGKVVSGQKCYVNPSTSKGTCARDDNCDNPQLALCPARPDAGPPPDGGVPDGSPVEPDQGPPLGVSFADDLTPLHKTDCARCHSMGQFNVKIDGTVADYSEVMRYVDANDPEGVDSYLWWSAGGGRHPISWPKGGPKYNLFLEWVKQGAKNN